MFGSDEPVEAADLDALEVPQDEVSEDEPSEKRPEEMARLEPDDLRSQRFILSVFGYDRGEVKAYLSYLADRLEEGSFGVGLAANASLDVVGEEVARILRTATEAADDLRRKLVVEAQNALAQAEQARAEATERLKGALESAEERARSVEEEAEARAREVASDAERRAEETVRDAEGRATALIAEAEARAAKILEEAERESERLHATEATLRERLMGLDQMLATVREQLGGEDRGPQ